MRHGIGSKFWRVSLIVLGAAGLVSCGESPTRVETQATTTTAENGDPAVMNIDLSTMCSGQKGTGRTLQVEYSGRTPGEPTVAAAVAKYLVASKSAEPVMSTSLAALSPSDSTATGYREIEGPEGFGQVVYLVEGQPVALFVASEKARGGYAISMIRWCPSAATSGFATSGEQS